MNRSILTITTIIALAIPAAVWAATCADSFQRVIGIEIATVASYQNVFQWNPE